MTDYKNQIKEVMAGYREYPERFFKAQWPAEEIWPKQVEICHSVAKNKRTYVRACHSSSKTHTAARLAIWWLSCWEDSVVITTAPTYTQVETILWGNMRSAYHKAIFNLGGNMLPTSPSWKLSDTHYGLGLSVREKDRFQGFHSPTGRVLVIVDEGSGVPDNIFEAINALLTSENCRLLVIGNPLRITGEFYRAHKSNIEGLIHINGYDAVKYSDKIPGLITQSYLDEQKKLWEEGNNPLYEPRCLGEFPTIGLDTVLNIKDVETAMANPIILSGEKNYFVSIDWAFGGQHETVVYHWENTKQLESLIFSRKEPAETIGRIVAWIKARQGKDIFHDNCGGGRVYGSLLKETMGKEYVVHDIDSSESGDETYGNMRSAMWFNAKEMLHTGGIILIPDPQNKEQLLIPMYFTNSKGKILITSKEDIVSDYNISPDRADATVYGLWGAKQLNIGQVAKEPPKRQWWEAEKEDNEPVALGIRNE